MKKNSSFKYADEVWSFLNKNFIVGAVITMTIGILGYVISRENGIKYFCIVLMFVYLFFAIKTIILIIRNYGYRKSGIKCDGKIIDYVVEEGSDYDYGECSLGRYKMKYLIVEYINKETGKKEKFKTPAVNSSPFSNLYSLDVNVYIKPNGLAWATDFRRI